MSSEKESTSLVKGPSGVEMAEGPGDTHTQLGSNFVDARELQYRVHIPGGYANGKTSLRMMIWNHSIRAAVDAVVRVEMTDASRAVQYAIVMPWTPADGLLKLKVSPDNGQSRSSRPWRSIDWALPATCSLQVGLHELMDNRKTSRRRKRAKHHKNSRPQSTQNRNKTDSNASANAQNPCGLLKLPNELLGEIASYFAYPSDLIALTRVSKVLYYMLTARGADYMWKRLRRKIVLSPVPDPLFGYTESSWARLLFGPNPCCGCGKETYSFPWSVALGAHVCKECSLNHIEWNGSNYIPIRTLTIPSKLSSLLSDPAVTVPLSVPDIIPSLVPVETQAIFDWNVISEDITSMKHWRDFEASLPDDTYEMDEVTRIATLVAMEKRMHIMRQRNMIAPKVLQWCEQHKNYLMGFKMTMKSDTIKWCRMHGQHYDTICQTQGCRNIMRLVKRDHLTTSIITLLDSEKEKICLQAASIEEQRRQNEALRSFNEIEKQIKSFYTKTTCPSNQLSRDWIMPCYKVFKTLPSVKSVLQGPGTAPFQIQNIRTIVNHDLKQWSERAATAVRFLLGYGDPSNKGRTGRQRNPELWGCGQGKLEPERRPSSLFVCKMCHKMHKRYKRLGVMDFQGICNHQCIVLHKRSRDQPRWEISNFAVATKAKAAVERMLEILNVPSDKPDSRDALKDTYLWRCNICTNALSSMDWVDMVRHCDRHDSPDISLVEPVHDLVPGRIRPSSFPTFAKLASGRHPEENKKRQFACAHCRRLEEDEISYKDGPLKDFNGMRSHLKAKHAINDVRSHDYYIVPVPTSEKEQKPETAAVASES
ncbi:hypothetical protein FRC14_008023 [Serendipita sp. 396]|nr:hypothetical protein FRC14_008023 [Serendipita sp. 396]